jgi:hypothetical protein
VRRRWAGPVVIALLLGGCSSTQALPETDATPTRTPSPAATGSATRAPAASPAAAEQEDTNVPPGTLDYDTGQTLEPAGAEPVWDADARSAAAASAVAVVTAFCHSGLAPTDWWTALAPALSEQAQIDYQYVDPANVPAATVTGAGVLTDGTSPVVAVVQVPTDLGTFTVTLTRAGAGAPWLAERITPPEGIH